ncbi:HEPN domain-containing protein [Microbispora sp. RL4-1S]|uniref:HEPN domain-containing protein n=1 Tax=Microbispora oryzae TaxID=2806554 RepID=A0A940WGX6_9ACTN|nr:HEPN domain-containing protein [Microbispora oryzae]MBP2705484.1 HEPN domain-containing protein [Microbispora oryzae]
MRWTRGEADIERMLSSKELQRVQGDAADGAGWLKKAKVVLSSAQELVESDPNSAYTLAYDGARFACTGLLAQQGLRATTTGGHYAVQQAVIRQFGAAFEQFSVMRRRRNELEYPVFPDETVDCEEAEDALTAARLILEAAYRMIDHLGLF